MDEIEVGIGTSFLAIFLIFMGIVSVFFSSIPPVPLPNSNPSGPPAEIQIFNKGGARISELWMDTTMYGANVTSRIYFRVFHSGKYPQVVSIRWRGPIAGNCVIHANPALSWVMEGQTYQDVEVAATPMSKLGVGEFQILIVTDFG